MTMMIVIMPSVIGVDDDDGDDDDEDDVVKRLNKKCVKRHLSKACLQVSRHWRECPSENFLYYTIVYYGKLYYRKLYYMKGICHREL